MTSNPDSPASREIVGPQDAATVPRYSGLSSFARLPRLADVTVCDVAVLGVPFDSGTSYRPGARFGPAHVREASRLLRPYNDELDVAPFATQQVADAGDVPCSPFDIALAIGQIEAQARGLTDGGARVVALGGDHTVALPLLRAAHSRWGPVALVHFDAHLDTWDALYGAKYVHGTPFRRAHEEGLFLEDRSTHVGVRSSVYGPQDFSDDAKLGFAAVRCTDLDRESMPAVVEALVARIGPGTPLYVSIDIDVLDPAHAPGTGTPETGGLTARELLALLRGLAGLNLVGADIVEVAPAYDHAQMTAIAASGVAYELISLMARTAPAERPVTVPDRLDLTIPAARPNDVTA
jgi:agmatinase